MNKFAARLLLLVSVILGASPALAGAVDIPVLTWERGRVQEIILGDTNSGTDWKLQLVGQDIEPITFTASSQNESGYYVYSASIPADIPVGAYSLETSGGGTPKSIVAGVNLVAAESYDIRKTSTDLIFVVGLFTFITVTLSSLRSGKYSKLNIVPIKRPYSAPSDSGNPVTKAMNRIVNLRKELTQGVQPSLFRHLLGQESTQLMRLSRPAYFALPLLAIAVGFFAATNAQASGGLEKSDLLYFFLITVVGLIDTFSGIFGLFTFWVIQFFYGDVSNLSQILIMVAAAIAWIGPSLAARVYQDAIYKDFTSSGNPLFGKAAQVISALGSAIAAAAIFFGGYKLLLSLLGEISDSWQMKPLYVAVIFVIALVKAFFVGRLEINESPASGEKFEIVRVVSPQIAMGVLAITFGFGYIWTASGLKALFAAALFSAPYFILFIRFEAIGVGTFSKLKRNILLESAIAVAASLVIYSQIQKLPQLSDQRAEIFLLAAAIPGLIHGIYSSICDSAQREGTIKP